MAIELAEMIEGLRSEMEKAQKKGKDKNIRFGVNNIELELEISIAKKVVATASAEAELEAKGLIKYFIGDLDTTVSLGAEGNYEKVSTQKIKLNLDVKNADGTSTDLSNSR